MFNSKKVAKSQKESNESCLQLQDFSLVPKETSTPVNPHGLAHLAHPSQTQIAPAALARQGTPRRYSLSALSTPSTSRSTRYQHGQRPLLNSLNYKDNVSMYEETKSCGLAKRIVLYNEEAEEERRVTHQQRYNGFSLFPVVHLFKQQPLTLGSSKRVKVKLPSPEYLRLCPPEQKRKLLKEMTKPKPAFKRQTSLPSHSSTTGIGTKSVLDALKEISRKRIRPEEEHEFSEEWGKRMKTHIEIGPATPTSKRARAESPLQESPTSPTLRQIKKKICVCDEFTASKSSSDLFTSMNYERQRIKRKTTSTSTESLIEPKQVKLVNVETQTIIPLSESKPESSAPVPVPENSQKSKNANSSIKVFDDARLDRIRKSRLAALMGNLAGKDAALPLKQLIDDEQTSKTVEEDTPKITENLTPAVPKTPLIPSAAPTCGPLPAKQDKHVHFNVPGAITSQAEPVSVPTSIAPTTVVDAAETPTTNHQTFSVNFGDSKAKDHLPSSSPFASPVSNKASAESLNASTPLALPFSKPPLFTSNASEKLPDAPPVISSKASPSKPGGFQFDLKAPVATPPTTSQNSLGLPSAESFIVNKPDQKVLSFGNDAQTNAGFGLETTTVSFNTAPTPTTPAFSFGTSTNEVKFGNFASKSPAAAGSVPTTSDSDGQRLSFAAPAAAQNSVKPVPSIGFGGSVPPSTAPLFGANQTSGFGSSTVSATANSPKFAFGSNQTSGSFPSATSVVSFGTTTTSSTFGNTTNFGAPATTSSITFGANCVPTSASFAVPSTTLASNAFGVPNTFASSFNIPTFGTSQSPFGATKLTPAVSAFGDVTLTVAPALNSSKMLGKTTQAPMFGSGTNSAFGAPVQSSSVFGAASTKSTNNPPPYGSIVFSAQTATSAPAFNTNSTPAFNFGANKTDNTFGGSTITTSSVFGSPTAFASTSTFGSGAPTFGTSPSTSSTFGAPSAPSFGQTDNKPAFTFGAADATPSSIFGSGSANSGFGKPANAPSSGFGSTATKVFGSSNPPSTVNTQQPTGGFNFGSNALHTSTPFAFGSSASAEPAKPSFNFTGQSSATFGSSSVPAPTFGGVAPTPNFSVGAAAPQQPGVFNIGTGSSVKQRAQLRAKRRT